jgi:hypothetical protein
MVSMVIWGEPPPVESQGSAQALPEPSWAKELVSHPGQWAMVKTLASKQEANKNQYRISSGKNVWQRNYSGKWEASYRKNATHYDLYVRYLEESE